MRKLNVTIVAGLVVALIGAALVVVYGRGVDQRIADGQQVVPVLVATQDIAGGTTTALLGTQVEAREVPSAYVVAQPMTKVDPASTQVTRGPITKGSQLSMADLGPATTLDAVKPATGLVDIAIQVDLSPGVARYVGAGSTVDMFVTYAGGTGAPVAGDAAGASATDTAKVTKLFASGVKVVSVSVAQPEAQQTDTATGQQVSTQPVADTGSGVLAVLEVEPALAEKIVNATTLGDIYLGLTSGETHTTGDGATPADVVASNR